MSVAVARVLEFSLHLMYCTPMKQMPASASTFRPICISHLHMVVKRVRNSTAQCRCVFASTDGPLNVRRVLRICLCACLLSS